MEAAERDGDPADLWITLEAMGYNQMLELAEVTSRTNIHTQIKKKQLIAIIIAFTL